MITPEQFKLLSPYSDQRCIIIEARTIYIMGDLDLHLQGHDFDLQGQHLGSAVTPEGFKLHSPYLLQISIIVRARTLFIYGWPWHLSSRSWPWHLGVMSHYVELFYIDGMNYYVSLFWAIVSQSEAFSCISVLSSAVICSLIRHSGIGV